MFFGNKNNQNDEVTDEEYGLIVSSANEETGDSFDEVNEKIFRSQDAKRLWSTLCRLVVNSTPLRCILLMIVVTIAVLAFGGRLPLYKLAGPKVNKQVNAEMGINFDMEQSDRAVLNDFTEIEYKSDSYNKELLDLFLKNREIFYKAGELASESGYPVLRDEKFTTETDGENTLYFIAPNKIYSGRIENGVPNGRGYIAEWHWDENEGADFQFSPLHSVKVKVLKGKLSGGFWINGRMDDDTGVVVETKSVVYPELKEWSGYFMINKTEIEGFEKNAVYYKANNFFDGKADGKLDYRIIREKGDGEPEKYKFKATYGRIFTGYDTKIDDAFENGYYILERKKEEPNKISFERGKVLFTACEWDEIKEDPYEAGEFLLDEAFDYSLGTSLRSALGAREQDFKKALNRYLYDNGYANITSCSAELKYQDRGTVKAVVTVGGGYIPGNAKQFDFSF